MHDLKGIKYVLYCVTELAYGYWGIFLYGLPCFCWKNIKDLYFNKLNHSFLFIGMG